MQTLLLDKMLQVIEDTPPESLAAVMAKLAACQSAVAARLLNGHQISAARQEMASAEPRALLSIQQVAQQLNVPKSYAYELVRQHKLGAIRLGKYVRVAPEVLAQFVTKLAASPQLATMSDLMKGRK